MQLTDVHFRWQDPDNCRDLCLPAYATAQAAGMDAAAAVTKDVILYPGDIKVLPTGFAVALPAG
ncbi:MAG: dUTP diphosphatase, partial [Candidatus Electrothrix sp. AUS1_2]|nr:dUTP diphosphatase [Candidatus Electrothrix sp. AUS1_2]